MNRFDLRPYLRTEVVDIQQPQCPIEDKMLIDTNVLYFCYYDRFSQLGVLGRGPQTYQMVVYPNFLKRLLYSQTDLFVHKIGLLEFANTIERAELQILYCRLNNTSEIGEDFNPKTLRREHPVEYRGIQGRLTTYLHSIKKTFKLLNLDIPIDELLANFFIEWQDSLADVGDAMMVEEAKQDGITSILSDDIAFATFKDIKLYTANNTAIDAYEGGS